MFELTNIVTWAGVFFSLIIVNEEKVYNEKFYLQIVKKNILQGAKVKKNQKTGTLTRVLCVRMHVMSSHVLRSCVLPFKSAMIGLSA